MRSLVVLCLHSSLLRGNLATFLSPFLMYRPNRPNHGCSFTTFESCSDASLTRRIWRYSFRTWRLQYATFQKVVQGLLGRNIAHCNDKFNNISVVIWQFATIIQTILPPDNSFQTDDTLVYQLRGVSLSFINYCSHTYSFIPIHLTSASSIPFSPFSSSNSTLSSTFCRVSLPFHDECMVDDNARSGIWSHHSHNPPPSPVLEFIEQYGDRLPGKLFSAMHLMGEVRKFSDVCAEHMHVPDMGTRTERLIHRCGHDATDSLFHLIKTDSLYVRCSEDDGYQGSLSDILLCLKGSPFSDEPTDLAR